MPRLARMARRWSLSLITPLALGACASYRPAPLPERPDLLDAVPRLAVDVRQLPLPALRAHPFNPENGLDMTEVATLAVVNNPDLKALRRRAAVAGAQLFSARLLPDPQLSFSLDHPTAPGFVDAFGAGLSYDILTLVTRGADIEAARAGRSQARLDLLWQEWQVVQQARTLYVASLQQARKLALLRRSQSLYAQRYARSAKALQAGDLTLNVAGTDLTALLDADTQLSRLERQQNQTHHDLDALLGVNPDVNLNLEPLPAPRPLAERTAQQTLAGLAARRPDLLALKAGYESQEAGVRKAILAQFPSLSIGLTRARDTSNVHTTGFGITVNLPFLNRNQGEIALQRATRAQLRQEYQARLDQARGQVHLLLAQQSLIVQRRRRLAARLPVLKRMVAKARTAYEAGDLDALTYLNMETTLLNKELEAVDLEQSLWEARIALDTLLATPDAEAATALPETKP